MSFEQAKQHRDRLESAVKQASDNLNRIKGDTTDSMGLTPDAVKQSADYQCAKLAYDQAFTRLRNFNSVFVRTFAKELRDERKKKHEGRINREH